MSYPLKSMTAATQIISPHLLRELEYRYVVSVSLIRPDSERNKLCADAKHVLSAFPTAIAAWEAFINEKCLSKFTKSESASHPVWMVEKKVDKWTIEEKTLLMPQLLFGKTFDKSTQPYQDFVILLKIRNFITHFRVDTQDLRVLEELERRNVVWPASPALHTYRPVPCRLETTEALRWAHNTVARMAIYFLESIAPDQDFPFATFPNGEFLRLNVSNKPFFETITDNQAKEWFRQRGLNPDAVVETPIENQANAENPQMMVKAPLR